MSGSRSFFAVQRRFKSEGPTQPWVFVHEDQYPTAEAALDAAADFDGRIQTAEHRAVEVFLTMEVQVLG